MTPKRILIVEDERVVAEQLRQTLVEQGHEVVSMAHTSEQAISQGERTRPDVVLMDIMLPGQMDGIAAAQKLHALGIPVIYLTGYSDRHLLDRAQHTEPLAYVMKPASSGEISAVIQLAMFKRDQEQERDGKKNLTASWEADEQFRLMVAGITDYAIFTLDAAGNVNSWNRGAQRINGYSAQQIMGQPHALLFTEEDRERNVPAEELAHAREYGLADNTRWLVRQNGERYWAEGSLTAIRDSAGVLSGFSKITRDGTERKRMEEELHTTQDRLRVALRAARMGTWDWEIPTNRDTLDENLRMLFGLSPDQDVNTIEDFYALLHPEDRAKVIDAFEQTRRTAIHLSTEFRVTRPGGEDRWFLDQGEVLLDGDGQPARMSGACVDITERKQAQEALERSEERFRLFVNNVRDYALFQMDPEGRITTWNSGAERVLGYNESEIIGQMSRVVFVPEDVATGQPEQELRDAAAFGRAEDERWHLRKDGTRLWCRGVVTAMRDENGQLRGFAKIMRDETERRQASEQQAASLREKEVLLKEIHHRVKNNLQVITSLLTLQSYTVPDESVRALFEETCNRVRSIGDIHELLYRSPDLARINFGSYLDRLVSHLLSFYGVDPARIHVEVNAHGAGMEIAEAIPCGLIVNELLTNSLKHGFPEGRKGEVQITFHCQPEGECVLQVSDNGVGMPSGFRLEQATSLGLKLASVLARQLQGDIRLEANGGTRVVITYPIQKREKMV